MIMSVMERYTVSNIVQVLDVPGASKTLKNKDGKTALDVAQESKEDAVVALLTAGMS